MGVDYDPAVAVEHVAARSARQSVVADIAGQDVVAAVAGEGVMARRSRQILEAGERHCADPSRLGAALEQQRDRHSRQHGIVGPDGERVVAGTAVGIHVARPDLDEIVASEGADRVVAVLAPQPIVAVVAEQNVVMFGARGVLDADQRIHSHPGRLGHALEPQVDNDPARRGEERDTVPAGAAVDQVVARIAAQIIVAVAAEQRVVPLVAVQIVVAVAAVGEVVALTPADRGRCRRRP